MHRLEAITTGKPPEDNYDNISMLTQNFSRPVTSLMFLKNQVEARESKLVCSAEYLSHLLKDWHAQC